MSMTSEELEKTGILKAMLDNADYDEETTIDERIEEFEEKIDYLNITEEKKEKLKKLVTDIKEEHDEKVCEFLFKELVKLVDEE